MSYHTCPEYRVYERYVNTIPTAIGEVDIHDYCLILWDKHLQIYTEYAFEMIDILEMVSCQFGYDIPSHLIMALQKQSDADNERQISKERQPGIYRKSSEEE